MAPTIACIASLHTARSCAFYTRNPRIADQLAVNHRKAEITPKQRAMLDFALKVCLHSNELDDADFASLRAHGFKAMTIFGTSAQSRRSSA